MRSEQDIRRDMNELRPYPPAQPWEWWSARAERLIADVPDLLAENVRLREVIERAARAAKRFAVHTLGWAVDGSDIERLTAAVLASLPEVSRDPE